MICFFFANVQLEKGNFIVVAYIANFKLGLNKGGVYDIQLNPYAACFIKSNIALGARLSAGISGAKGSATTVDYGLTAIGRYYISDPTINVLKHTRFFLEASAGI